MNLEKLKKQWYVLYVSSRQEKKVSQQLLDRGIESYLPLIKTLRVWSDRKKIVEFPLISGYVFVRIDLVEKDKIFDIPGVVNFVRHEGRPAVVRPTEIDNIKQLIALGYEIDVVSSQIKINSGDKVKVKSGIFKDLEGVVLQDKETQYFVVSISGIGYDLRVKIPGGALMKI